MIHVIAPIRIAEGRRAEFLDHFHALVPLVRAEQGCVEYGPTVDATSGVENQKPTGKDVVTVVEKWESIDALEAHLAAPHMVDFREKVSELVVAVDLHILEPA